MTARQNRVFVVLHLPKPVPKLLLRAEAYVRAMTGNAWFPKPRPRLAVISAAIAKLVAAQTKTLSHRGEAVSERDAARDVLVAHLRILQAYVQAVADADPEEAAAIIESAAMDLERPDSRNKAAFVVKPGPVAGSVRLEVRALGGRTAYFWAFSSDGGKTWTQVEPTTRAYTIIKGLPIGKRCLFRHRALTIKGETDWSEPLEFLVG
jgi:hypothetical protein